MIYHFPPEHLPDGFVYPSDFLNFAENIDEKSFDPWHLQYSEKLSLDLKRLLLKDYYPRGEQLVPFAKLDVYPILACFYPHAEYPSLKVVTLDLTHHVDFEPIAEGKNFTDWLHWANCFASEMGLREDED